MHLKTTRATRFAALILAAFLLLCAAPGQAIKKIDLSKTPAAQSTPNARNWRIKPRVDNKSLFETARPTLRLEDTGKDVTALQNKLYDLGYMKEKADGEYGYLTERAVWLFQLNNSLEGAGVADSTTQRKLFGDSAKAYTANLGKGNDLPPLVMAGRLEWQGQKSGKVRMRVKVMNVEQERTVDNFTIRCWFEDAYGDRVSEGEIEWDNRKKVKPGKTVYSDYHIMPYASSIYTCHFAISRIHMTNGDAFYPTDDEPVFMDFVYDP